MEAVFAKPLSEKPFSRERCFATTLGIPPDVKQSAEGWWCALGWPREHLLRTSSSCELAWAKIWTDNTLARSLRAVRIATIISLILIGLRSIVWSATRILINLSHWYCMHVSHTRRRLSLIVVALRNRCLRRVTSRRNDSLHWIAICWFNITIVASVRRVYANSKHLLNGSIQL